MWCVRRDGGGRGAGGWHSAGGGARVYRWAVPTGLARQAGGGAERGDVGRDDQRVTGGVSDWSGAGAGARAGAQTRDQAGGPAAQQPGHRCVGQLRPLGAARGRHTPNDPGRHDWTEFDGDGQATLALHLVTGQGRTTPLLWLSVWKDELTDQRNAYEDACLVRLSEVLPAGCQVTLLADRGFGDHKLFAFLAELGFGYVIRFRGNIHVTDASGETR